MAKIRISEALRTPSFNPARGGKEDVTVFYTVDGKGPRTVIVPAETYSEQAAEQAIRAQEMALIKTAGREFTI